MGERDVDRDLPYVFRSRAGDQMNTFDQLDPVAEARASVLPTIDSWWVLDSYQNERGRVTSTDLAVRLNTHR